MNTPLIEFREAGFTYGRGGVTVQNISFQVHSKDRVVVLGANGSGKSTLLKLAAGLLYASSGSVLFKGQPLQEETLKETEFNRAFRSQIGLVFQNADNQLFSPTVWDEIAFGPLQVGFSADEVRRRVGDLLSLLRIEALQKRAPFELSGGEKKRVAIASVLAMNPEVLLLDEPTLGLDPRWRWELVDILVDLHQAGKTLVTATNDLEIVEAIADRSIVLGEKKTILREGSVAALLADQALLEEANLIHIHAHRHPGGGMHRHPHQHPEHRSEHHS